MIKYKPQTGTLLICDYKGSIIPEMNKKSPVLVIANKSHQLCTVIPLSTTTPQPIMSCHYLLETPDPLPKPYSALNHWVKCDMIATVSYNRLDLPFIGKDKQGKRIYDIRVIPDKDLQAIFHCVLNYLKNDRLDKYTQNI